MSKNFLNKLFSEEKREKESNLKMGQQGKGSAISPEG
jgi:hypothetical protein